MQVSLSYVFYESTVSLVSRGYMRVVKVAERLVVCLSEYLPLRSVCILVVSFSDISRILRKLKSNYMFMLAPSRKKGKVVIGRFLSPRSRWRVGIGRDRVVVFGF